MNTSKELGVDTAQQSVAIRHTSEHKATAEIRAPFPLEKPGESEKHMAYTFPPAEYIYQPSSFFLWPKATCWKLFLWRF